VIYDAKNSWPPAWVLFFEVNNSAPENIPQHRMDSMHVLAMTEPELGE